MARTLVIIPARAGSKGVPLKNFRNFYGHKSLVDIAIEFALKIVDSSSVVLTSDYSGAYTSAMNYRIGFHSRSTLASSDESTATDVLLDLEPYLTSELAINEQDFILYLQPTSPFRSLETAKQLIRRAEKDAFFSGAVAISPIGIPLSKILTLNTEGEAEPPGFGEEALASSNRQSGVETFVATGDFFMFRWSIWTSRRVFPIFGLEGLKIKEGGFLVRDIDTELEFEAASKQYRLTVHN